MDFENKSKCLNILYTVLLFTNNFAFGISINLIGATLVDLSFVYDTSINTISYINFCLGIGYLTGSFSNYLYRWLNRQLTLGILVLLFAVLLALLPFYKSLWLAFGLVGVGCLGAGALDSAQSIWLVEIWPVSNTALLQGLQFMYGVGSITAPLLASPFVHGKMNVTRDNQTLTVEDRINSLTFPFILTGIMQSIVPIIILIMFFTSPFKKQNQTFSNEANTQNKVDNQKAIKLDPSAIPYRSIKLALISVSVATYIAGEYGFLSYSTSMYQYLDIHLSASEAAHVQSLLSGTFTAGRLITAFVSLKLKMDFILTYHYVIQIVSILTIYFGRNNLMTIYIGTAGLGLGFSAIWPGMFAFTETNLHLTDRICSLFVFLSGSIGLTLPLVLGQAFKTHPIILIFLTGTYILISFSLFLFVKFWISFQPKPVKQ